MIYETLIKLFSLHTKSHHQVIMAKKVSEPISNTRKFVASKASDQPAHTRILIRAFACRLNIL